MSLAVNTPLAHYTKRIKRVKYEQGGKEAESKALWFIIRMVILKTFKYSNIKWCYQDFRRSTASPRRPSESRPAGVLGEITPFNLCKRTYDGWRNCFVEHIDSQSLPPTVRWRLCTSENKLLQRILVRSS